MRFGVHRLSDKHKLFPPLDEAREDGLLAYGGDLSVQRLVLGYASGIFPWYSEGEPILWWCPPERYIIKPSEIHISHSMKKFMKKHECKIYMDRNFEYIIHRCMEKHKEEGVWITKEMEEAYIRLHEERIAHSIEAFIDGEFAGGLYGVDMGIVFCGESMFSELENGSKVALILFAQVLAERGVRAIDCQFHTDHLESMGGMTVTRDEYIDIMSGQLKI